MDKDLKVLDGGAMPVSIRKVMQLEEMIKENLEQIDPETLTKHYFADGIYVRSMFLPADSVATGKIHRTQHITIVCNGTVRITTDEGVKQITGPAIFVSEPGIKKAVYALTDTTILNVHPAENQDLKEIEQKCIAPSYEAYQLEHQSKENI